MCDGVLGSAFESQQRFVLFFCTEMMRVAGLTELLARTSCCVWLKVKLHKAPTATDAPVLRWLQVALCLIALQCSHRAFNQPGHFRRLETHKSAGTLSSL